MTPIKGILGEKLGMTQIFEETRAVPVTVIKAGPCFVAQVKTKETDGYDAVQLAFAERAHPNKPMQGHFDAHGGDVGRHVVELRTDDASSYTPGQEIRADVFAAGERADVVGVSQGQGVRRRHEASRVRRAWARATARRRSTVRPGRSARAPRPRACSRACGWPARWATSASPS